MNTKLMKVVNRLVDDAGQAADILPGALVFFVSDEEDYVIVESLDGCDNFPVDYDDVALLTVADVKFGSVTLPHPVFVDGPFVITNPEDAILDVLDEAGIRKLHGYYNDCFVHLRRFPLASRSNARWFMHDQVMDNAWQAVGFAIDDGIFQDAVKSDVPVTLPARVIANLIDDVAWSIIFPSKGSVYCD